MRHFKCLKCHPRTGLTFTLHTCTYKTQDIIPGKYDPHVLFPHHNNNAVVFSFVSFINMSDADCTEASVRA